MNVRVEAATLLQRVLDDGAFANRLLDSTLSKGSIDERDKGLLTELLYGSLRQLLWIDHILDQLSKKGVRSIDKRILCPLRIAVYQLIFLDRVPDHAVVSEAVKQVRSIRGAKVAGFANALLRKLQRSEELRAKPVETKEKAAILSRVYSHPLWLVKRYLSEVGTGPARKRMLFHNEVAPLTLRVHRGWGSREKLVEELNALGAEVEEAFSPDGLFLKGGLSLQECFAKLPNAFVVQDVSSQWIAPWLGGLKDEQILDACSAPGGKAIHLAGLNPNAQITALDLHPQKLKLIRETCKRLGIENLTCKTADATQRIKKQYDRILCDAPCSGLGTLRKHPEVRYRRKPEELGEFRDLQLRLLQNLSKSLKPGGILVYSVCTDTTEECDEVVSTFLAEHQDFSVDKGEPSESFAALLNEDGFLRLRPERNEMDIFFAVRLRKANS